MPSVQEGPGGGRSVVRCRHGQKGGALIGFRGLMLQTLFEKHNAFLRPLKKKGFKEERVTTIGWYDIGKSHDPGIQQEPPRIPLSVWPRQGRGQRVSPCVRSPSASAHRSLSPEAYWGQCTRWSKTSCGPRQPRSRRSSSVPVPQWKDGTGPSRCVTTSDAALITPENARV